MLLAAGLLLALPQSEILACHPDAKGKFTVTEEQWFYIHQVLESRNSAWVLKLIHPKRNLKIRVVNTSFPDEKGNIRVYNSTWNAPTVVERLKYDGFYDVYHPGFTYEMTERLVPGHIDKYVAVKMKGGQLYEDDLWKAEGMVKETSRQYAHDYNRLSPTTYIRMTCSEGRLWLSELSSGSSAE